MPTDPTQRTAPPHSDTVRRPRPARPCLSADPRPGHPRNAHKHAAYRFTDWAMI